MHKDEFFGWLFVIVIILIVLAYFGVFDGLGDFMKSLLEKPLI